MKINAKMEEYLSQLERALGAIATSEKAEIIMEIKSHILSAIDNDPNANVDQILASLGAPQMVANRYLLERGLRPVSPPKTGVFKWFVLGILGLCTLFVILAILIFYNLSPIIEIDERSGHVSILGGMIDINEMDGTFQIGSTTISDGFSKSKHEGRKSIDLKEFDSIRFDFTNGKFELENSEGATLSWDCESQNLGSQSFMRESGHEIIFDFGSAAASKCDVKIPKGMKVHLQGPNGRLKLKRPNFSVSASITNGSVSIRPSKNVKYRYDLSVVNGIIDEFNSSADKDAISIKIALVNGKIDRKGKRSDD
ncbi:hypothetical protein COB52_05520 [Candidatus Kaiserbacteria bacterium]|nr:MAG: hypothetical protein COB52_05520 [Candidatus Kaiserbacteria bacterium]